MKNKSLQTALIRDLIKRLLKKHKYTYAHLADALGVTESTAKRIMSKGEFSLDRLELVASWFGFELHEFIKLASYPSADFGQITERQEQAIVQRPESLYFMILCSVGFPLDQVQEKLDLNERDFRDLMMHLEKYEFIEVRAPGSIKLLKRGPFMSSKDKRFRERFMPIFFKEIVKLIDIKNPEDHLLMGEMYLSDEMHSQMQKELRALREKYMKIGRVEQEVVDIELRKPVCFLQFSSQYDMWGKVLMEASANLPSSVNSGETASTI